MTDTGDGSSLTPDSLADQAVSQRWSARRGRGRIDIRIDREGRWLFRNSPIERPEMVRLFASLMRREDDGEFVLDAPEQILHITVDDAPFVAIDGDELPDQSGWQFETNTGEKIIAGPEHPLLLRPSRDDGEHRLYVLVRDGLEALVHRNVFYRLAEQAESNADGVVGIVSQGEFFALA